MNIPNSNVPRIVVIGGGFAGISFIKKMRNAPVQIVLFDRHNYHTFQPLLYQVSTAGLEPDSIAYPLRKIFRKNKDFHFRMATVTAIHPGDKMIDTSIGSLSYDYLVLATGTKTNYFGNKSIEDRGMAMKTVPQALNIRSLILQNIEEAARAADSQERAGLLNFVIAGAGPTGVELAGALAEFRKGILENDYPNLEREEMQVHLIEGSSRVLAAMSEKASRSAMKSLLKLGVRVHLKTLVTGYDGTIVTTNSGLKLHTATFIWTAGVTGNPVPGVPESSMIVPANRYHVDRFNAVQGLEAVYALGDIAYMQTELYPNGHPQVAQPAIQQGRLLAKNLLRKLKSKPMKAFEYKDKGTMATIGRNSAVADIKSLSFGGSLAWFLWMFVHIRALVGFRNRVVTFINWSYNYINYDRAARLIIRPFKRS